MRLLNFPMAFTFPRACSRYSEPAVPWTNSCCGSYTTHLRRSAPLCYTTGQRDCPRMSPMLSNLAIVAPKTRQSTAGRDPRCLRTRPQILPGMAPTSFHRTALKRNRRFWENAPRSYRTKVQTAWYDRSTSSRQRNHWR